MVRKQLERIKKLIQNQNPAPIEFTSRKKKSNIQTILNFPFRS